jgi:hypothetical protein
LSRKLTFVLGLVALSAAAAVAAGPAAAVDQQPKNGCMSPQQYSGAITSPQFTTSSSPQLSFQA